MTLEHRYNSEGYAVIATGIPDEILDEAKNAHGPLQPLEYHWNPKGKRVFEAWKTNDAVRTIAHWPYILEVIKTLTGEAAYPFQTINFDKGTNQRLHQDGVHFQTFPRGKMIGVWVALEDMDEENGTLMVVPRSHHAGYFEWQGMGFEKQKVEHQYAAYAKYEDKIENFSMHLNGEETLPARELAKPVVCSKGDAIIWGLELFHGGWPIKDEERTRHSQVTHYFLEGARSGWAPMFSDPTKGDIRQKSMRWFDIAGNRHHWSRQVDA